MDLGEGPEPLHAFVMVLSHSRKTAVVWSRREDQLSWLECHNESFRRLGGIVAVNRIDKVKTAIAKGAGAWGEINPTYRSYAQAVGFHVDACTPGEANAKGKVEAKVRLGRLRLDPTARVFDGLEHLQPWTDERNDVWAKQRVGDRRVLRLIHKWLSAGVMENGKWTKSEMGSPQGVSVFIT